MTRHPERRRTFLRSRWPTWRPRSPRPRSTEAAGYTLAFHEVCSQTYDPSNYANCIADWGPVELDTLNPFLDWLQDVGAARWRTAPHPARDRVTGDQRGGHPDADHHAQL